MISFRKKIDNFFRRLISQMAIIPIMIIFGGYERFSNPNLTKQYKIPNAHLNKTGVLTFKCLSLKSE